jgi:hypothetical protein
VQLVNQHRTFGVGGFLTMLILGKFFRRFQFISCLPNVRHLRCGSFSCFSLISRLHQISYLRQRTFFSGSIGCNWNDNLSCPQRRTVVGTNLDSDRTIPNIESYFAAQTPLIQWFHTIPVLLMIMTCSYNLRLSSCKPSFYGFETPCLMAFFNQSLQQYQDTGTVKFG